MDILDNITTLLPHETTGSPLPNAMDSLLKRTNSRLRVSIAPPETLKSVPLRGHNQIERTRHGAIIYRWPCDSAQLEEERQPKPGHRLCACSRIPTGAAANDLRHEDEHSRSCGMSLQDAMRTPGQVCISGWNEMEMTVSSGNHIMRKTFKHTCECSQRQKEFNKH